MKKVIFLDFDGVMDDDYYDEVLYKYKEPRSDKYGAIFDPYAVSNLRYLISQTDAKIVISSTWKCFMSFGEIQEMWKDRKLPGLVIDTTPDGGLCRGDQIKFWLEGNGDDWSYVILDDLDSSNFLPEQFPFYIGVDPYNGLSFQNVKEAIQILNNKGS